MMLGDLRLYAYIGPGAGFALAGSFLALLLGLLGSLLSIFIWPFRALWGALRYRRALQRAHIQKLIFIGFDGLDPRLTERLLAEGKLPNLAHLQTSGGYHRLRTTFPVLSPVAWSTFATGVNPAKHNIFDFLNRSIKSYIPELSSAKVNPPARTWKLGPFQFSSPASVEGRRRSESFWTILGRYQIKSTVLRVPVTFPPEKFNGRLLSAMCTPDLKGTQGSFSLFTTGAGESEVEGGARYPLHRETNGFSAFLEGPQNSKIPFQIRQGLLRIQGQSFKLQPHEYSPWIRLNFHLSPLVAVSGIVRFLVTETEPQFSMYASPVQIDPERPSLPISHPATYALYLAKLFGSFATLGMAEDTWALNEGAIGERDFLNQAYSIFDERLTMFTDALQKTRKGVVGCVFDTSDRIQHMFFRQMGAAGGEFSGVVEDMYQRMDAVVGDAMRHVDSRTALFVLSDHGFCAFNRGVNLNAWLRENGYLNVVERTDEKYFAGVDWKTTRAYALGLGGVYLNLRGREPEGTVSPGAEASALKAEIIRKLSGLPDTETGKTAIRNVYDTCTIYVGPYLEKAPDLIIGYNEGYRTAWGAAVGRTSGPVFEQNDKAWSGDHCVDPPLVPGVLFANRNIDAADPGLEDLAPTILRLFGVDPPAWMEGKPIFRFR